MRPSKELENSFAKAKRCLRSPVQVVLKKRRAPCCCLLSRLLFGTQQLLALVIFGGVSIWICTSPGVISVSARKAATSSSDGDESSAISSLARIQLVTKVQKIFLNGTRQALETRIFPPPMVRLENSVELPVLESLMELGTDEVGGIDYRDVEDFANENRHSAVDIDNANRGTTSGSSSSSSHEPAQRPVVISSTEPAGIAALDIENKFVAPETALVVVAPSEVKCRLFGNPHSPHKVGFEFEAMKSYGKEDFLQSLDEEIFFSPITAASAAAGPSAGAGNHAGARGPLGGPNVDDHVQANAGAVEVAGSSATEKLAEDESRNLLYFRSIARRRDQQNNGGQEQDHGAASPSERPPLQGGRKTIDWLDYVSDFLPESPVLSLTTFHQLRALTTAKENHRLLSPKQKDAAREVLCQGRLMDAAHGPRRKSGSSNFFANLLGPPSKNSKRTTPPPPPPPNKFSRLGNFASNLCASDWYHLSQQFLHLPDCPADLSAKFRPKDSSASMFRLPIKGLTDAFEVLLQQLNARPDFVQVHGIPVIKTISCRLSGEDRVSFLNVFGDNFRGHQYGPAGNYGMHSNNPEGAAPSPNSPHYQPAQKSGSTFEELASLELHDSLRCAAGWWLSKAKLDFFLRLPLFAVNEKGVKQYTTRKRDPGLMQQLRNSKASTGAVKRKSKNGKVNRHPELYFEALEKKQGENKQDQDQKNSSPEYKNLGPQADANILNLRLIPQARIKVDTGYNFLNRVHRDLVPNLGEFIEKPILLALKQTGLLSSGSKFGLFDANLDKFENKVQQAAKVAKGREAEADGEDDGEEDESDEDVVSQLFGGGGGHVGGIQQPRNTRNTGQGAAASSNDKSHTLERRRAADASSHHELISAFLSSEWEHHARTEATASKAWFVHAGTTKEAPSDQDADEKRMPAGSDGEANQNDVDPQENKEQEDQERSEKESLTSEDVFLMTAHELFLEGAPRHRVTFPQVVFDVTKWPRTASLFSFAVTCRVLTSRTPAAAFSSSASQQPQHPQPNPNQQLPPCGLGLLESRVELWLVTADVGSVGDKARKESEYMFTLVQKYLQLLHQHEHIESEEMQDVEASPVGALRTVLASTFGKRRKRMKKFLQNEFDFAEIFGGDAYSSGGTGAGTAPERQEQNVASPDEHLHWNTIKSFDFYNGFNTISVAERKFQAELNFGLDEILSFVLKTVELVTPDVPLPYGIELHFQKDDYILRYGGKTIDTGRRHLGLDRNNYSPDYLQRMGVMDHSNNYQQRSSSFHNKNVRTDAEIEDELTFYQHRLRISNKEVLANMLKRSELLFELLDLRIPAVISWKGILDVELVIDIHGVLVKPNEVLQRKFYGGKEGGGENSGGGSTGARTSSRTTTSADEERLGVLQFFPCVTLKEMSFLNWEFIKSTIQSIVHGAIEKAMVGVNRKLQPFFFRY
ncbi:unnamed protein product [Amoebophrya sp. A120]|nr:unnamed protein product [Amoebophrya sp. A120]|eukprot:GSA120T00025406001.1